MFCGQADNELETPWKRGIDAKERRRNVKRTQFSQQQLFGSLYECSKNSIFKRHWTAVCARYRHGDITKDSWEVSVQAQLTYHCVHTVNMCVTLSRSRSLCDLTVLSGRPHCVSNACLSVRRRMAFYTFLGDPDAIIEDVVAGSPWGRSSDVALVLRRIT